MFQALYEYLYHQAEDGGIPLKGTGIVVGLVLLAKHLWAWFNAETAQNLLKQFPRNFKCGAAILTVDFFWAMLLLNYMDMGEFFHLRKWFLTLVPIGFVLVLIYVQEFLAVRALGALMLLLAGPVLTAAYLQPQTSRLLLPILAYAWIIAGMFFVGMPYLMRDWVSWLTASALRWKIAVGGGATYGAVLLAVALVDY